MERRTFLQRIGSILTVLGLTEVEWLTLGNHYYQALAQPAPKKLALLVGINKYSQSPALAGCVTDVELQKELLINRFGFAGTDILTLTEEQASREFIEAAVLDHLGKQTQAEDVVVFHFSGYGSQVWRQNALVPVDERNTQNKDFVNYVLEETLLLLLRSLPTKNVTAILDTSYGLPETFRHTGLKVRSLSSSPNLQLVSQEQEFLQRLKNQTSQLQTIALFKATVENQQVARELLLSNVNAGLFTYALTQYLWEVTPPTKIYTVLTYAGSSMYKLGSTQQPILFDGLKPQHLINSLPDLPGAEGVIKAIEEEGKTVKLLLTGLPAQVLESYGASSRFITATGDMLTLRSRTGLNAKAQPVNLDSIKNLQVGQLVQESIRSLPRNISLTVALDPGLERIERVDATSAFASSAKINTVVAGEQPADCIFGKQSKGNTRYALFSRFGELIPNTIGDSDEAVKLAVKRLLSKLPTLLAAKLWQLTDNQGSSRLAVQGTLEIVGGITPRVVIHQETLRTHNNTVKPIPGVNTQTAIPQVPIGSRMQYRLQNLSDRPLYITLVGLNNSSNAIAFYPWQVPPSTNSTDTEPQLDKLVIPPGITITIPETAVSEWAIPGLSLFCQHQIIFSTAPFTETFVALTAAKNTGTRKPIATLANPLEVAQALLQDLHNASTFKTETTSTTPETLMLDVHNWASLNFSFQVV